MAKFSQEFKVQPVEKVLPGKVRINASEPYCEFRS